MQCILCSYFVVSVNAYSFWSFDSAAGVSLTHATPALHATLAYTAMGGGADTDRAETAQWLEVGRSVGRERALVVGGMDDGASGGRRASEVWRMRLITRSPYDMSMEGPLSQAKQTAGAHYSCHVGPTELLTGHTPENVCVRLPGGRRRSSQNCQRRGYSENRRRGFCVRIAGTWEWRNVRK